MLFYHFEMLDNFIEKNLTNNIEIEKENINQIIKLYENKKSNLQSITTNIIEITDSINPKKLENFHDTISSFKNLFEDINAIHQLAYQLKSDLTETLALYKNMENNKNEIKANLVEYNKQREELSTKIFHFENQYNVVLNSAISFSLKTANKKAKKNGSYFKLHYHQ